jgi:hypothetical protein
METLHRVLGFLRPHWNTLTWLLTWAGIAVAYPRRRARWRRKHFLAEIDFSLNHVRGGAPVLRTLLEKPANEVWLNEHGARTVLTARRTTADQPFVLPVLGQVELGVPAAA